VFVLAGSTLATRRAAPAAEAVRRASEAQPGEAL